VLDCSLNCSRITPLSLEKVIKAGRQHKETFHGLIDGPGNLFELFNPGTLKGKSCGVQAEILRESTEERPVKDGDSS
jgi:hypothetical protein